MWNDIQSHVLWELGLCLFVTDIKTGLWLKQVSLGLDKFIVWWFGTSKTSNRASGLAQCFILYSISSVLKKISHGSESFLYVETWCSSNIDCWILAKMGLLYHNSSKRWNSLRHIEFIHLDWYHICHYHVTFLKTCIFNTITGYVLGGGLLPID